MSKFAQRTTFAVFLAAGICLNGCSKTEELPEPSKVASADEEVKPKDDVVEPSEIVADAEDPAEPSLYLPSPEGAQAMAKPNRVWVDKKNSTVFVDGYISLQEGMLEMFACPKGTKEHESVVAVYSSAQMVHAALLAVGAKTGTPVKWNPKFSPPTGTEIAIEVHWKDAAGEWQKSSAQEWIVDARTGKTMENQWVFAGSGFWKDESSGEEFYMGESGDFICVSNFSSATLDIPTESSQVNDGLLFEANAKKVPPLGTPVRLVLKPKLEE